MLVLLLTQFMTAHSIIVDHDSAPLNPYSYQTYVGVAMYSSNNAPQLKYTPIYVGDKESYIDFDLTLQRSIVDKDAFVELFVIPDTNISHVGFKQNGNLHLCCNQDIFGIYGCDQDHNGSLIIPNPPKGLYRKKIYFNGRTSSVHFETRVKIEVTGIHVFAMSTCDSTLDIPNTVDQSITIIGSSTWINPYGQLSAEQYNFLPFYGWMMMVYLLLCIIWILFNRIYFKSEICRHHIQNSITIIVLLCLIDMMVWYIHYFDINKTGYIDNPYISGFVGYIGNPFIFGFLVTFIRYIVSSLLFIGLCNGYGIFKKFKSIPKKKGIITIIIVIISWIFVAMIETKLILSEKPYIVIFIIKVIMTMLFGLVIFRSLKRSIINLKVKPQTCSKLIRFYKLIGCLFGIYAIFLFCFGIYNTYCIMNELYIKYWDEIWFTSHGYVEVLFLLFIIGIMILLRPSNNQYMMIFNDEINKTHTLQIQLSGQIMTTHGDDDDDDDDDELEETTVTL